jgi:hypothetical protein
MYNSLKRSLSLPCIMVRRHTHTHTLHRNTICQINVNVYVLCSVGQLSTDNSHVCALVKAKKGDNTGLALEIKTPSQSLSDALLDELISYLT